MKRSALFRILATGFLLGVLSVCNVRAQQHSDVNNAHVGIQLKVDNDSFTFPQIDDYYSSGIILNVSALLPDSASLPGGGRIGDGALRKVRINGGMGHRLFTPDSYYEDDPSEFDRPYAGWAFLNAGLDLFYGQRHWIQLYTELGVVGPAAQAATMQTHLHRLLGFQTPEGWDYQINNTPALDLQLDYQYAVVDKPRMQLLANTQLRGGTIRNFVRLGAIGRWGNINELTNSQYTGTNLLPREFVPELYVIGGLEYEYVIYNTLIEGNFIGTPSPHTEETEPWVRHEQYGLAFSRSHIDVEFLFHRLSREIPTGRRHRYLTVKLTFRY